MGHGWGKSMKLHAILAAGAAVFSAGTAHAYTIDFDAFVSATSYSEGGATITANGEIFTGENTPGGSTGILAQGSPRAEFTATFAVPTDFVSVDLGDFNADSDLLFLEAFDIGNVLLGSSTLLISANDTMMHTLSVSFAGIASARFGGRAPSINGNSVYADNLTFNVGNGGVPEPSAWALLIIGFGAVGAGLRSRRKAIAFA